jgi:hypothetical protein
MCLLSEVISIIVSQHCIRSEIVSQHFIRIDKRSMSTKSHQLLALEQLQYNLYVVFTCQLPRTLTLEVSIMCSVLCDLILYNKAIASVFIGHVGHL